MRVVDDASARPRLAHAARGRQIWVMDTIAVGSAAMAGDLIVTGSHGGRSAGEYAAGYGVALVACNDAGLGKNAAGVAGLAAVDALGMAGVGVGHDSARIGDGEDAWAHGIVSYVNDTAASLGLRVGSTLRDQLVDLIEKEAMR